MRKKVLAVVLAVLAFSLIAASAASLGGVSAADVGADTGVVASCDSDGVTVSFTTAFNAGVYEVDSATVGGIHDDCVNQGLNITLSDGTGAVLDTGNGTVTLNGASGNDNTVTVSVSASASALEGVAIVISG